MWRAESGGLRNSTGNGLVIPPRLRSLWLICGWVFRLCLYDSPFRAGAWVFRKVQMLLFTLASLFVALFTGAVGFGTQTGVSGDLGKMLFFVFIQLFLIGMLCILFADRRPRQSTNEKCFPRTLGINI